MSKNFRANYKIMKRDGLRSPDLSVRD